MARRDTEPAHGLRWRHSASETLQAIVELVLPFRTEAVPTVFARLAAQSSRLLRLEHEAATEANRASVIIFVELDGRCDDLPVYARQQQKPGSPLNPKRLNAAGQ